MLVKGPRKLSIGDKLEFMMLGLTPPPCEVGGTALDIDGVFIGLDLDSYPYSLFSVISIYVTPHLDVKCL